MREIKFRLWDKDLPGMDYDCFLKGMIGEKVGSKDNDSNLISLNDTIKYGNNGDCPIMKYTGLKDKNGKEIYESDIVRCKDGKNKIVKIPNIYVYNFDDGAFVTAKEYEIIGNIYCNPELLNKEVENEVTST